MEWQNIVVGVITATVLAAFAPLALRAPPAQGDATLLRYPKPFRIVMRFAGVFSLALAIAVVWPFVAGTATDKDARTAAIGLPVSLVLLVVAIAEPRVALLIDGDGIRGQTAFRGRREIAWQDVVEVKWSRLLFCLVLVDRGGSKLSVTAWLQGHRAMVAMLRERVPEIVWRDAVAAFEKSTAAM